MYPMTLEAFQNDPALRRRLFETAHRERARAIRDGFAWLLGGFVWLRDCLTPRVHFRPSRWIKRLG
ncbi:MAG: hypothetical protein AABM33_08040 [Pseudomonadota bacterium]